MNDEIKDLGFYSLPGELIKMGTEFIADRSTILVMKGLNGLCFEESEPKQIIFYPAVTPFFSASNSIVNVGQEIEFQNATTPANALYIWSFGDGTTSQEISPRYSFKQEGEFEVTLTAWTAPELCGKKVFKTTITVLPKAQISITSSGETETCSNSDLTLSANIESPENYAVQWFNENGSINCTSIDFVPNVSGEYYCVVTDANGNKSTSNVIKVKIYQALPENEIILEKTRVCSGTAIKVSLKNQLPEGVQCFFTLPNGETVAGTSFIYTALETGKITFSAYYVNSENVVFCSQELESEQIFVSQTPSGSIWVSDSVLTVGEELSVKFLSDVNSATMTKTIDDMPLAVNSLIKKMLVVGNHIIRLTIKNAEDCATVIEKTINVLPALKPTFDNEAIIVNDSTTLFENKTESQFPINTIWSVNNVEVSTDKDFEFNQSEPGNYLVKLRVSYSTDAEPVKWFETSKQITVYPKILINGFKNIRETFCLGDETNIEPIVSLYNNASSTYNYEWRLGNEVVSTQKVLKVIKNEPGFYEYSLKVTDKKTNATASKSITIHYVATPLINSIEVLPTSVPNQVRIIIRAIAPKNQLISKYIFITGDGEKIEQTLNELNHQYDVLDTRYPRFLAEFYAVSGSCVSDKMEKEILPDTAIFADFAFSGKL